MTLVRRLALSPTGGKVDDVHKTFHRLCEVCHAAKKVKLTRDT